jgi:hypothetical protein
VNKPDATVTAIHLGRFRLWMPPLAALLCVAASCLIRLHTGGLRVDENYPALGVSIATAFLFLAALAVSLVFLVKTCLDERAALLDLRQVRNTAFAACLVAAFMLPMLSNDVFSVLAYGDLALRGIDPFSNPSDLSQSAFFSYVGDSWKSAPCVYGPVALILSATCVWLGMGNIYLAFFFFKLFSLAACLILVQFAFRYVIDHPEHADCKSLTLLTLSPILWLQGAGQAHIDLFAGMFLMMGVFFLTRERYRLAAFLIICASLTKLSALVGVLFYAVYLYNAKRACLRCLLKELAIAIGIMAVTSIIFYAAFWKNIQTLTDPIFFVAQKRPSNSVVMVFSNIVLWGRMFFESLWQHGPAVFDGLREFGADPVFMLNAKLAARGFSKVLFLSVGIALMGVQLIPLVRKQKKEEVLAAFARTSVVVVTIAPAVVYPWYLLIILPFFIKKTSKEWTIWFILVSVISNGLNIPRITDQASIVYRLLDPLFTYATIFLFVYAFHARFFRRPEQ